MTADYNQPGFNGESDASASVSIPLVTLDDWRHYAGTLERERDNIGNLLERHGKNPADNPHFTHLLGKLSVAQSQIVGLATQALEKQFEE